jgi:cytochrome b
MKTAMAQPEPTKDPAAARGTAAASASEAAGVPVWDLPTRLFHWILVALVVLSYVTEQLDDMEVHKWSGITILTLLLFRVAWGFFGGTHARFASFVCGPRAVIRYARGLLKPGAGEFLGHNPLGGWSVVVMLVSLLVQACSGLFANDDSGFEGPLAKYVSKETSDFFSHIHSLNINLLYVLVGLHVLAILFYLFKKRENLVAPMITGYKRSRARLDARAAAAAHGSKLAALVLLLIAAAAVYYAVIR